MMLFLLGYCCLALFCNYYYFQCMAADNNIFLMGLRFYVVHSYVKEEDVQVSVWPVCMDAHDSNCRVYTVLLHCCQHF